MENYDFHYSINSTFWAELLKVENKLKCSIHRLEKTSLTSFFVSVIQHKDKISPVFQESLRFFGMLKVDLSFCRL